MAKGGYERKDPVVYAAQRRELALRVRDGMAVRAAARVLNIPYSTAWLWIAQDGLRRCDRAAEAAGEAKPPVGNWAKPGRGRAPHAEGDLPPADYPELRGLSGRKRLTALHALADTARMRAVSAIEEGCIGFALSSLREASRLMRAWRALNDWIAYSPEAQTGEPDQEDWRAGVNAALEALEDCDTMMARKASGGVAPPPTPEEIADAELQAAVEAAFAAQPGWTDEDRTEAELDIFLEVYRLKAARAKWMSLPGRGPMPVEVRLPPRREAQGAAAPVAGGPPAYEPFPIIFGGRRI